MAEDSKNSVAQLRAEVSTYETRLRAVEELALRDSLTGLANRHNIEERIQGRIANRQTFCVASIDLNRLKQVNDTHGHPAGDNLLKQFSQELRSNLGSSGVAGRWGGDEFIVILDCDSSGASALVERIRKWVFGDYTLQSGAGKPEVKVRVEASIGVVQWRPGETLQQVIERSDAAMYQEKESYQEKRCGGRPLIATDRRTFSRLKLPRRENNRRVSRSPCADGNRTRLAKPFRDFGVNPCLHHSANQSTSQRFEVTLKSPRLIKEAK